LYRDRRWIRTKFKKIGKIEKIEKIEEERG
jgi:hypothetical protein